MTSEIGFFTHLMTSETVEYGPDMITCPSFEAAYLEVVAAIPDIAADILRRGLDPMKCAFLICNDNNHLLETVHFGELVRSRAVAPEPASYDLLLPVFGCTVRERAKDALDQLQRTMLETRTLIAAGRKLQSKIDSYSDQTLTRSDTS